MFKSQIGSIKVVHSPSKQRKHVKVLHSMNLGNSEVMALPCDEQQRCWGEKDAVQSMHIIYC